MNDIFKQRWSSRSADVCQTINDKMPFYKVHFPQSFIPILPKHNMWTFLTEQREIYRNEHGLKRLLTCFFQILTFH